MELKRKKGIKTTTRYAKSEHCFFINGKPRNIYKLKKKHKKFIEDLI